MMSTWEVEMPLHQKYTDKLSLKFWRKKSGIIAFVLFCGNFHRLRLMHETVRKI